ncbi:MAG: inositol monophosphatase, partial [Rhodospirillaceae bacterium]|nr:inositol monophosphatase [Rhodospirillaceae bacterium]
DPQSIAEIILDVAETEIMPRYQSLSESDISEKQGGEVVTVADEAAERALSQRLSATLPGSTILGEEGYAADPSVMRRLEDDAPLWIIDPIDGTKNFAQGREPFTVLVALVIGGETVMGWNYDPVSGRMGMAEKGSGADYNGRAATMAEPKSLADSTGFCASTLMASELQPKLMNLRDTCEKMNHPHCFGHEYLDLIEGVADFSVIGRLYPWDHAAGVLMFSEAGGITDMIGGEKYQPTTLSGLMILATNLEIWQEIKSYFD